jgi:hypothetical protein
MGLDVAVEVVDGGNEEIEGEVLESKRRASSLSSRKCAAELGFPWDACTEEEAMAALGS